MAKILKSKSAIEKQFFVIDSRKLEEVESRFYGYCYDGDKIYSDHEDVDLSSLKPDAQGAFISVNKVDGKIIIQQDYIGCYGLYIFRKDDYFALSNSFLMLVDYLKDEFALTFNEDYANAFFAFGLVSYAVEETMVREISLLLRNKKVVIDIKSCSLSLEDIDYQEETVQLDSPEGVSLVDAWHSKWTGLIRRLKGKTNNIVVDLSGGFDSRITLMLFLTAGIDMSEITINSSDDGLSVHGDDYRIASAIASQFDFSLNKSTLHGNTSPFSAAEKIDLSFFTKLCFHKEMYFPYGYRNETVYHFTGAGGETLRNYNDMSPADFITKELYATKKYNALEDCLSRSMRKVIENSYLSIKGMSGMPSVANRETVMRLYQESRTRNHYGKAMVEGYFGNTIQFSPTMDPMLHKIKKPPEEIGRCLFAFIFKRYCEKLLDFDVEGNRSFGEATVRYAESLNTKYPLQEMQDRPLMHMEAEIAEEENIVSEELGVNVQRHSNDTPQDVLLQLFHSEDFHAYFRHHFSEEIYQKAKEFADKEKFHPLRHVYSVIAAARILMCCKSIRGWQVPSSYAGLASLLGNYKTESQEETPRDEQMATLLKRFSTARIDIKNKGSEGNDLCITTSDKLASISNPNWFCSEGRGYILESDAKHIKLRLEGIGDGTLTIMLRGIDYRDAGGKRMPFFVDYRYFSVNEQVVFDSIHTVHHDKPYRYTREIKNGEFVDVEIGWEIHAYSKDEMIRFMYWDVFV